MCQSIWGVLGFGASKARARTPGPRIGAATGPGPGPGPWRTIGTFINSIDLPVNQFVGFLDFSVFLLISVQLQMPNQCSLEPTNVFLGRLGPEVYIFKGRWGTRMASQSHVSFPLFTSRSVSPCGLPSSISTGTCAKMLTAAPGPTGTLKVVISISTESVV